MDGSRRDAAAADLDIPRTGDRRRDRWVSAKTTRTGTKRRAQVAGLSDLRFTDTNRVPTQSGGPRGSPPAPRRTFRGGGDAAAAAARINPRRRSRDPDSDVLCRTRAREDVPGARTVVRPNAL